MDEQKKTKRVRAHFYIERDGFMAEAAMILVILSCVFRLIGSLGRWSDELFVAGQMILPVMSCILLALCIMLFGKKGFWLSALPVFMGAVFFTLRAFGFGNLMKTVLCICLYFAVAVLYTETVFGLLKTKWLLPPIFAVLFAYQVCFVDLPALRNADSPVTFTAGMLEMSILCMIAAMFFVGLGLKKKKPEPEQEVELPKIKDPVVIIPKDDEPEQPPQDETAEVGEAEQAPTEGEAAAENAEDITGSGEIG